MKKLLLFILFTSGFSFAQKRMPILPECKEKANVDDIKSCFTENFNKSISKTITYLASSSEYLLIPNQDFKLKIKINNKGEIKLADQEDEIHPLFYQLIEFYLDQLNEENLRKGGIKPALDENGKASELNFKLPIKYNVPYEVNNDFRNYERILSMNVDKKVNLYHLILTPNLKLILRKNGQDFKNFDSIKEYLDYSKKLLLETSYLKNDFNLVNTKDGLTVLTNHWLTPSENSKRIIIKDKNTNNEYGFNDIEEFLESPYTELMFNVNN